MLFPEVWRNCVNNKNGQTFVRTSLMRITLKLSNAIWNVIETFNSKRHQRIHRSSPYMSFYRSFDVAECDWRRQPWEADEQWAKQADKLPSRQAQVDDWGRHAPRHQPSISEQFPYISNYIHAYVYKCVCTPLCCCICADFWDDKDIGSIVIPSLSIPSST